MDEPKVIDFGGVLEILRRGGKAAREGWNGKGMFIELQKPDEHSKMKRSYIFMSPTDQQLVPWVASQSDLLAVDWYEVK